jgi:hypothetical protein
MDQLYECCAVDCNDAGQFHLIVEEYTGKGYEYREEQSDKYGNVTGMRSPVINAYYCRKHAAEKLQSLADRLKIGGKETEQQSVLK